MTHEACESYQELLAASVLSALDADDAHALTAHLESCADCSFELGTWENSAALLALTAAPLEPSARVREQILATVRTETKAESSVNYQPWRLPSAGSLASKVTAFERPRRDIWTSLRSFGAIAAALVIVALISSLVILWRQNQATRTELARLSAEMEQARAQLNRQSAMGELLAAPESQMARLAGTNVAPKAHAMLAYDKGGHAMLMARGLPIAPKGMAYQLWFIKDNQKMPGKMLTTDAAGNGMMEDQIPTAARDKMVFALTLEPEAGVRSPTGSIYLVSPS